MRILTVLLTLAVGWTAVPEQALANCDVGGREVPCAVEDGHYRIRTPDGPGPHPAVVYLYGSLGNSAQKLASETFVQAFVERGYAVIVPAALDLRYRDGLGSGFFLRNERSSNKRDEIAFLETVLDDAEVRHRINRKRLMIVGMSRGGFLTWDIACHRPDMAQAYAPVAAGYMGAMPQRCEGPAHILHTHGRADEVVPLNPSTPLRSAGATMMPLGEVLRRAAQTGGCVQSNDPVSFREYDRTSWSGCPRNASVELLLHDGSHTIPLSWYGTVIDWFEGLDGQRPATVQPVATALPTASPQLAQPAQAAAPAPEQPKTLLRTGARPPEPTDTETPRVRPGFKAAGTRDNNRFKRVTAPSQ